MSSAMLRYTSRRGVRSHLNLNLVENLYIVEANGDAKVWARTCSGYVHDLHTFEGDDSGVRADQLVSKILRLPAGSIVHIDDMVNPAPRKAPQRLR